MSGWQRTRRVWPRVRQALDVVAIMMMIAASGALLLTARPRPAQPDDRASRDVTPPSQPVPLKGAAVRGNPNARVGMVLYTDFQCPFCRAFARDTLPAILKEYLDRGEVLLAIRHVPLERRHERSVVAATAAVCAGAYGKFWGMHDQLFLAQLPFDEAGLNERALNIGLDPAEFTRCLRSEAAVADVRGDMALAAANGVHGTPTVHIGMIDRDRVTVRKAMVGAQSIETIRQVVVALLPHR